MLQTNSPGFHFFHLTLFYVDIFRLIGNMCLGGFLQLDSVTLICHGLRHWLLFVGRVGCFHGFAVMSDVTSSIFVVSRLPFLPLGFFFLRIMFSKGLRLCQYYKVTYFLPLACLDVVSTALEK